MASDKRRLLLALSNEDEREMYVTYLWAQGFDVEGIQSAGAVAASLAAYRPDLIVIDTRLGGNVDSVESVRAIRQNPTTRVTPLIVITGNSGQTFMREAQEAGANECLLKPVYPELLLAHIERLLLPVQPGDLPDGAVGGNPDSK